MIKIFDGYDVKARLFPALLCSIPFVLIKHFAIDPFIGHSVNTALSSIVVQDITLVLVLIYLLSQINRFISKSLFEKRLSFPTTEMLLPSSNELSADFRKKINDKVRGDFHVLLPTLPDEQANLTTAKKRISEIVSLIIHKVGKGTLLLQHNIEYGFVRNLIGGSALALVVSIFGAAYFHFVARNVTAYMIFLILIMLYTLPIIFSRPLLKNYSQGYAWILFREYVA